VIVSVTRMQLVFEIIYITSAVHSLGCLRVRVQA
jgi:hypothetical protein